VAQQVIAKSRGISTYLPETHIFPTFGENEMSPTWQYSFLDWRGYRNIAQQLWRKYWGPEYGGPFWLPGRVDFDDDDSEASTEEE
jgi:hypothetical protein